LIVQHNINATDAIILQSCLDLQQRLPEEDQLVLLSSDKRLLRAAQNNNVSVLDPEVANFSELQVLMNS
jgi:hypothetical protein